MGNDETWRPSLGNRATSHPDIVVPILLTIVSRELVFHGDGN
jgi:hypothetical protein